MRQIIYSALRTPDGTLLESRHRHDYRTHEDKNGKHYMIDGGNDYVRCSINGDEEMITIYADDDHEVIREHFRWGVNYDKDMNRLPETKWTLLKDLRSDHIEAILAGNHAKDWREKLMKNELLFRLK